MAPWKLTAHLLSTNEAQFKRATQSAFLLRAAHGTLPRYTISDWLANDRLYMLGYIRLAGHLLRILQLPLKPTPSKAAGTIEVRLLDWLVDALVNIRREERFFMDVAERYEIEVDMTVGASGNDVEERKSEGLKRFERLFGSLTTGEAENETLPWLEGVVLFWATEKVYFEAWSWAKREAVGAEGQVHADADGGAMRKEFIPNWTNAEFIAFVNTLERILDEGVLEVVGEDDALKMRVTERAEKVWGQLLDAEEAFWPDM